jgi:hypothetical protein
VELATAQKRLEELQAAWASEAYKVWDFLGQTEKALAPLGFSLVHPTNPVEEVSVVLPLLYSAGTKMLQLEDVVGD